jgi:hypothetical protein
MACSTLPKRKGIKFCSSPWIFPFTTSNLMRAIARWSRKWTQKQSGLPTPSSAMCQEPHRKLFSSQFPPLYPQKHLNCTHTSIKGLLNSLSQFQHSGTQKTLDIALILGLPWSAWSTLLSATFGMCPTGMTSQCGSVFSITARNRFHYQCGYSTLGFFFYCCLSLPKLYIRKIPRPSPTCLVLHARTWNWNLHYTQKIALLSLSLELTKEHTSSNLLSWALFPFPLVKSKGRSSKLQRCAIE